MPRALGDAAIPAVQRHSVFVTKNRAEADAIYLAALKAVRVDNGPPDRRSVADGYPSGYYAAFVLDPDGNNVEAVFRKSRSMV